MGETSRGDTQTPHCPLPQSHPFLTTVVDGVLLPKMPEEILAEKDFNTVPYIVGINKQEFGWLLPTVRKCRLLTLDRGPTCHRTSPVSAHRTLLLLTPLWDQGSCALHAS